MKGWKTLGFALLVAIGGVLQAFDWATVVPQDKTWSGIVMLAIAAVIAALRVVTNTPVGTDRTIIKILILALGVSLFLPSDARASDVSGPAAINKAVSYQYPTTKCGFYYGVNSIGSTGAVGGAPVGTQQVQGNIGLTVGYTCPAGAGFWFADGAFDFTNLNGKSNGLALGGGPAFFEQRFGFGAPIDLIMGAIPGLSSLQNAVPSLIPLPSGVTVNTSNPYLFASLSEQDVSGQFGFAMNKEWLFAPGLGIGNKVRLSNGVVFDPFAEYVFNTNSMCFGPLGGNNCVRLDTQVRAGFHLEF